MPAAPERTELSTFGDDPALVVGHLADPVVVVDERMVVTGANLAAGRLFGLAAEDLVGRLCLDWVHEPDRVESAERLAAMLGGAPVPALTVRLLTADGRPRWAEVTGNRFVDGDAAVRGVISIRDIGGRLARELASARIVSRSHLMSQLAVEFQSVTPGHFSEAVTDALRELGEAVGAVVVALHEVETDGTSLVLRARWVSGRSGSAERVIAPGYVEFGLVPRLLALLNDGRDLVEITAATPDLAVEARGLDGALSTVLAAPLRPGEDLLGSVAFGWDADHLLTNDERDVVTGTSRMLGTALERVRALQALQESEAMFRDMFHRSSAVMYLVDPESLRLVDVNAAAAAFYGYARETMVGMSLHELTLHTREDLEELVAELRTDASTTVIDERQRRADGSTRDVEIHSTPMRIGRRAFDVAIVQDVTEQRLAHQNLQHLASTDELTGSLNRRRFYKVVQEEIRRAERYERPASLIMLDLDHFKAVNDTLGHVAGDEVLVAFAESCRSLLRVNDHFARLGGEEFGAFLPEGGLDEALAVAERIRAAAEERGVTVSAGVVEWVPGQEFDALYARADKLLYEAKQAGRNRVVG